MHGCCPQGHTLVYWCDSDGDLSDSEREKGGWIKGRGGLEIGGDLYCFGFFYFFGYLVLVDLASINRWGIRCIILSQPL